MFNEPLVRDDSHRDFLLLVLNRKVEEAPAGVVERERRRHGHEHRDGGAVSGLRRQVQRRVLRATRRSTAIQSGLKRLFPTLSGF